MFAAVIFKLTCIFRRSIDGWTDKQHRPWQTRAVSGCRYRQGRPGRLFREPWPSACRTAPSTRVPDPSQHREDQTHRQLRAPRGGRGAPPRVDGPAHSFRAPPDPNPTLRSAATRSPARGLTAPCPTSKPSSAQPLRRTHCVSAHPLSRPLSRPQHRPDPLSPAPSEQPALSAPLPRSFSSVAISCQADREQLGPAVITADFK